MTVARRIMLMQFVTLCLLVLVGAGGLWQLGQAQFRFTYLQNSTFPSLKTLIATSDTFGSMRVLVARQAMAVSVSQKQAFDQAIATADQQLDSQLHEYEFTDAVYGDDDIRALGPEKEAALSAEDFRLLAVDKARLQEYRSLRQRFLAYSRNGDSAGMAAVLPQLGQAGEALRHSIADHVAFNSQFANALNEIGNTAYTRSWIGMCLACGLTIVAALLAGGMISRSLMRELGGEPAEAVKLMKALAAGEVVTELKVRKGDEASLFAHMRAAAQLAIENIRIRKALDAAAASVMITDDQNRVVYMNRAANGLFQMAQSDIRREIAGFSAESIIGRSMNRFNPQRPDGLAHDLRQSHRTEIEAGGHTFSVNISPVFGAGGALLGTTMEWADRTEALNEAARLAENTARERALAAQNARIRTALDNVSTSVMIADIHRTIIYLNRSAADLMQRAECDLRGDLAGFQAADLMGTSLDVFRNRNQVDVLAQQDASRQTLFTLGGHSFAVVTSPVFDASGERLGVVLEWTDRTTEVRIEQDIARIVNAATLGDFERRVQIEGTDGFFKTLGASINQLLDVTSSGLQDIASVLSDVARGDLTHTIDRDYQGLFGTLKQGTNTTVERLCDIVRDIKESTDLINTAAREISAGNTHLSSRTEQQAASLEETASSMEEITSTVRKNAENAKQANRLAIGASEIASQGGSVVGQVVSTMNEINESARKIVDIIGVIDGIAFQTNILALNAAVEAARAGEQGRGFAVVASEVRNLAQRSAGAAKEIAALIGNSVDSVESGARLVNDAGRTMQEIVSSITRVTDIMSEISAASIEQSSGIEQVNRAVAQMDENTQKNAALVEEAAASAESLAERADRLAHAVALFRLREGG